MREVAIVGGVRSPFCKAGGVFAQIEADDLAAWVIRELLARLELSPTLVDEVILGNVLQPPHLSNIARIAAVKGGVPVSTAAFTVSRNCASGMEAVASAASGIEQRGWQTVIAGGTESMSHFPILFGDGMRRWLLQGKRAKSALQKFVHLLRIRPHFFKPVIPGIADPLCGLVMGETAEVLARAFHVTREEQDAYALMSHQRASAAIEAGKLAEEIVPIPLPPDFSQLQLKDVGPRSGQTIEQLASLKPHFDRLTGTVTAGTSSQVTDGACALLLMDAMVAKERGIPILGIIRGFASAGVEPNRMGLGPVFAVAKLLEKTGYALSDFDRIELNEAFAAQVLAVCRAAASNQFAKEELDLNSPLGEIDLDRLNVNGGAIALGHPVGTSGARLILTLLMELKRSGQQLGLATLCVGGGQGQAMVVEAV